MLPLLCESHIKLITPLLDFKINELNLMDKSYTVGNSTINLSINRQISLPETDAVIILNDRLFSFDENVSKFILKRGGESIRRDAVKRMPVTIGDVVLTSAGYLHQSYVLHIIGLDKASYNMADLSDNDASQLISRVIDRCFKLIDATDCSSFLIPVAMTDGSATIFILHAWKIAQYFMEKLMSTGKGYHVFMSIFDLQGMVDLAQYNDLTGSIEQAFGLAKASVNEKRPKAKSDSYDVFLSYSRDDFDLADRANAINRITDALDDVGISYWIDQEQIHSGMEYTRLISNNIKNSKVVLFISSKYSNSSQWTSCEIGMAFNHHKTIIPFRIDDSHYDASVELLLSNVDYIDASKDMEGALRMLQNDLVSLLKN